MFKKAAQPNYIVTRHILNASSILTQSIFEDPQVTMRNGWRLSYFSSAFLAAKSKISPVALRLTLLKYDSRQPSIFSKKITKAKCKTSGQRVETSRQIQSKTFHNPRVLPTNPKAVRLLLKFYPSFLATLSHGFSQLLHNQIVQFNRCVMRVLPTIPNAYYYDY